MAMNDAGSDPDTGSELAQELLPTDLRKTWVAIPRTSLYQILLVGILFGSGVSLSIAGLVFHQEALQPAFEFALVLMWMQNLVIPWPEGRLLRELARRDRVGSTGSLPSGGIVGLRDLLGAMTSLGIGVASLVTTLLGTTSGLVVACGVLAMILGARASLKFAKVGGRRKWLAASAVGALAGLVSVVMGLRR
jgi:hypothetical protein